MQPDAIADVVVMTVKAALAPVLERLAVAEARLAAMPGVDQAVTELRERVVVAETKAAALTPATPVVSDELRAMFASGQVLDRLERADRVVSDLTKDVGALRERVAVVEVRGQVPGPPGKDGVDGADGIGWGDLTVTQGEDERTFTFQGVRDGQVKSFGSFFVPVEIYRGVWLEGKSYERGDCVTWGGSEFHCNDATSTRPETSKAWTLKVKRGRDGRDGKDAPMPLPVVSVGGSRG